MKYSNYNNRKIEYYNKKYNEKSVKFSFFLGFDNRVLK